MANDEIQRPTWLSPRQQNGLDLKAGDRIIIHHPTGTYHGTVRTAHNYHLPRQADQWYIELTADAGSPCGEGYTYWKQGCDGTCIDGGWVEIEPKAVVEETPAEAPEKIEIRVNLDATFIIQLVPNDVDSLEVQARDYLDALLGGPKRVGLITSQMGGRFITLVDQKVVS